HPAWDSFGQSGTGGGIVDLPAAAALLNNVAVCPVSITPTESSTSTLGGSSMRIHNRSLHSLFVTACLSAAVSTAVQAQEARWSDPATWPNNKVPAAGDLVEIPAGKSVVLDVNPPALNGLTIHGKLRFADESDLALNTEWIMVHGELEIGTEAKPYTHNATITLTDNVKGEQLMGMGDRGIMISGGTLNLHGNRSHTWTKLAATAEA